MSDPNGATQLTKKDFVSDQEIKWCPGCGDYAILATMQKVLPDLGIPREKFVLVSGIGCSSRFPYYMNTYGFHTIHGRAPAFASGLKAARPDLSVWVITGDGDGLSIGGNHLIHVMRRNVNVNVILFNNRIYGLTKGQYSPTSEIGKITKSSPMGSVEPPFNPTSLALAAGASFVARSIDREPKHLAQVLARAARHEGVSFVEVLQNCNVFNDGAFEHITAKPTKADQQLVLEHGQPMLFGANRDRGIRLRSYTPEVVQVGEGGVPESELLVHDEHAEEPVLAELLSRCIYPAFPTPMGILRDVERPIYDVRVQEQIGEAQAKSGVGDEATLDALLSSGATWVVD